MKDCAQQGASDLMLIPNEPPLVRLLGQLRKINGFPALSPADCKQAIYSILNEQQRANFESNLELDCAYHLPGVARFRVNVFLQHHG
ncbi:MAG: twitching motility protein PilT, partial [Elusimicrobia bacterium]|nr:twitching motility protein PilT [Elusimicrobiota bacterium]